ncbi:MAG: transposase [Wendovervirus sonii]|uniref:Transposase n=1 Tax=phage Lak_Megaphage_Sonny TaxID=3109229 RepID=A0ABZ0Z760_9CAUD|nr:MAG: transposase [phage Lak_Megaphage_Sonny]
MTIDQNITKTFCSYELTDFKYQSIHEFASVILSFKNKISEDFNNNVLTYLTDFSVNSFVTFCRNRFPKELSANFDHQLYDGVFNDYSKKFEQIRHNLEFHYLKFKKWNLKTQRYKGQKYQYAESVKYTKQSNDLTKTLNFIVKYGSEDMLNWCQDKLNRTLNEEQRQFYESFFRIVEKFGFERLFNLAMQRRERILKNFENPIQYKSLTFRGRCNKKDFIGYNKNKNSVIGGFITLSIPENGKMKSISIPVKLSNKYHGNLKQYMKANNVYMYTLCFDQKRHEVSVNLCKSEKKDYYDLDLNSNVIGIDVNVKNNLFALSNGQTYSMTDQMQETVNEYLKVCLYEDELRKEYDNKIEEYIKTVEKEQNTQLSKSEKNEIKKQNPFKIGKKLQRKKDVLKRVIVSQENDLMSQICKDLQEQSIHHVAMEDLDQFGQSFIRMNIKKTDSEEEKSQKIKYNRLVKFIGLSDLNNMFEHISRKYEIQLSKVHAAYTSQTCNECGYIDKENRKTQENFLCLECENENNADINAAKNIKDRVSEAVLREGLLTENEHGSFKPKKKSVQDIYDFLSSPAVQSIYSERQSSNVNFEENYKAYIS